MAFFIKTSQDIDYPLVPELAAMAKKFPTHPKHPERICWGCDKYCATDDLKCGNGSDRTQHPMELFGDDWQEFQQDSQPENNSPD